MSALRTATPYETLREAPPVAARVPHLLPEVLSANLTGVELCQALHHAAHQGALRPAGLVSQVESRPQSWSSS